jgi:hypothetical protein
MPFRRTDSALLLLLLAVLYSWRLLTPWRGQWMGLCSTAGTLHSRFVYSFRAAAAAAAGCALQLEAADSWEGAVDGVMQRCMQHWHLACILTRHCCCCCLLFQLEAADSWEGAVDEVMQHFELEHQRRATYTICYY